jgi:hypothetical protein
VVSDRGPTRAGRHGGQSACRLRRGAILRRLPLLITALVGCGGPETNRVPLARVTGTVTLDGEPLEKAVVVFESEDGAFSFGETDTRGRYELRFDSRTRGTTFGTKIVRISMNRRIHGLNSNDEGGPEDTAGGSFQKQPPERIPEKYNQRSVLTADVTEETATFNFDLVSHGSIEAHP